MKPELKTETIKNELTYRQHPTYSSITCGSDGSIYYTKTMKKLQGSVYKNGYRYTTFRENGGKIRERTHRLICESFYGLSSLVVNHKDGNKWNNSALNLEWVTISENTRHAIFLGKTRSQKGELSPNARLTYNNVVRIHHLAKIGVTQLEIAKIFSISRSQVSAIIIGRSWAETNETS